MTAETTPEVQTTEVQEAEPLGVYTETLARLYWRQGYLDKALQIYRHLAAEQPDEPHFQDQISALVQQLDTPSAGPPDSLSDGPAEPSYPVALGERVTAVESVQTQQVVAQLERWLSCLQRKQ